jgi:phosphoglycerate kinase
MTGKLGLRDLSVEGKKVFVRVDYNVPLKDGRVGDDRRIRASLGTIRYLLERSARIILASHLGRPKGRPDPKYSLKPVAGVLADLLGVPVAFSEDCLGAPAEQAASQLASGGVLLLENLRFHPEEEKNDDAFSARLASLADLYVNDAFGSAHRAHASTVGICRHVRQAAAGFLMEGEVNMLSRLLENPARPYLVLLGGAKVSDKIPLAENLLGRVDGFLIGGAMAYTFLKVQGIPVGASLVEAEQMETAADLLRAGARQGVKVLLPEDHVVLPAGTDDPARARTTAGAAIADGDRGVDIGPRTLRSFRAFLSGAKTVLWNGPAGWFEKPPFDRGSRGLAEEIASSPAFSVAGGGDTAAAVSAFGLDQRFSHVSTGGGAALEYLSGLPLPGLAALTDK